MSNTFDLLWPFVCRFQKSAPMLKGAFTHGGIFL